MESRRGDNAIRHVRNGVTRDPIHGFGYSFIDGLDQKSSSSRLDRGVEALQRLQR